MIDKELKFNLVTNYPLVGGWNGGLSYSWTHEHLVLTERFMYPHNSFLCQCLKPDQAEIKSERLGF